MVLIIIVITKPIDPNDRFELYERGIGTSKSDKEFAIRLSLSEGAHSSNVLDSAIDAKHALNVQPRKYVVFLTYLYVAHTPAAGG
jgi:hypothetical protein